MFVFLLTLFFANVSFTKEPLTFRVRLGEDLGTLDWNNGEVNGEIVAQLMEGLFSINARGEVVAAAAKSVQENSDKTLFTINLAKDRFWSDGKKLCAQQFVDSFERLRDKAFASPYAHYANPIAEMSASDCYQLTVRFKEPTAHGRAILAQPVFFPIRLDQLQKSPKIFTQGKGLLVNGAYEVESWKLNSLVRLKAVSRRSGRAPRVKVVEYYFVPDESTAKVLYEEGKLDFIKDIPKLMRNAALQESPEFRLFPALITYYFGLHEQAAPSLKDVGLRKALSNALLRSDIPKILGEECLGQTTWLSQAIFPGLQVPSMVPVKADLPKVTDLKLRVYNKSAHKLIAEWAQQQWKKNLGIDVPIEVQEGKVYWKELGTRPPPIFISGVTAPYAHPNAFLQEFLSTSTANWASWKSAEYDQAVRSGKIQEAESNLERAGYVIPLYSRNMAVLIKAKWKNFQLNPLGQFFAKDL